MIRALQDLAIGIGVAATIVLVLLHPMMFDGSPLGGGILAGLKPNSPRTLSFQFLIVWI